MNSRIILFLIALIFCAQANAQLRQKKNYIRVDQFGYLPSSDKVAVISKAVSGFNAGIGIDADVLKNAELRLLKSDSLIYSAPLKKWNNGNTDSYSGDKGFWFDFSVVATEGEYIVRVYDTNSGSVDSYPFKIANDVYNEVLRAAVNMFYYQRVNQEKTAEFASGANWTDGAWFGRSNQDISATYLGDKKTRHNISRGWIDAGDPNKYVTFAVDAVHCLLTTYDQHRELWDNFWLNIPESGNSIPDLLDEIKWEIDWLMNMQDYPGTGGLFIKAGILNDGAYISPPSSDTRVRYYDKLCPSSSVTGAGMMAHAALAFGLHKELKDYSIELKERAEAAWNYYASSSNKAASCDNGDIEAGDADGDGDHYGKEHLAEAACAAVYLYALTGNVKYHDFFKKNYTQTRPWLAGDWGMYRSNQAEAVLFYLTLNSADKTIKDAIIAKKTSTEKSQGMAYSLVESDNLYRSKSFYSNWGSNSLLARQGTDNMDFLVYDLLKDSHSRFKQRAQGILHYFHGVNPFGLCYLSNMYMYNAEFCVDEMWHSWFSSGTRYDNIDNGNVGPAPGYLSGGFNSQANSSAVVKIGTDIFAGQIVKNQPIQKAFTVDNNWTYSPWVFNEPGIYYQAGYVKLLAHFATANIQVKDSLKIKAINGNVSPSGGYYKRGSTVTLKAEANPGYRFSHWNGDIEGNSNPTTVSVDSTIVAEAIFIETSNSECGLFNPNFEDGLHGWIAMPGAELAIDSANGTKAIKLAADTKVMNDGWIIIDSTHTDVIVTFNAKVNAGSNYAAVSVQFYNNDMLLTGEIENIKFSTTYAEYKLEGIIPVNTRFAKLCLSHSGLNGSLLADNFCIVTKTIQRTTLKVNSGSGSGTYKVGERVKIIASNPPANSSFSIWTGDTATVEDVNAKATYMLIPDFNTTVNATYSSTTAINSNTNIHTPNLPSPNPFNDILNIETPVKSYDLKIYNLTGGLVFEKKMKPTENSIDLKHLPTGTYMLKCYFSNTEINYQITKI